MPASLRINVVVAALALATACGPHQTPLGEAALPARNPDIISHAELSDPAIAAMDALTAIRQLRPSFFRDSESVLAYRSLTDARDRLLTWLASLSSRAA